MPYCPKCHAEYRPGKTRCPDCDCDLVESLPGEQEYFDREVETVLLYHGTDYTTAMLLEEALKEKGIPCDSKSSTGPFSGYMSLNMAMKGIRIYVPKSAFSEAREIAETIVPDYELPHEKD